MQGKGDLMARPPHDPGVGGHRVFCDSLSLLNNSSITSQVGTFPPQDVHKSSLAGRSLAAGGGVAEER